MKLRKVVLPLVLCFILIMGISVGTAYGTTIGFELPVDLPFSEAEELVYPLSDNTLDIIDQWENMTFYEPPERLDDYDDFQEVLDEKADSVESKTDEEVGDMFSIMDMNTFQQYKTDHPDEFSGDKDNLFIDKVDKQNTPTGIKTTRDDDVLALDAVNGILILGRNIEYEGGTSHTKIAYIADKSNVSTHLVKDLNYWGTLDVQCKAANALLGINASNYTLSDLGDYGILYGAAKYHGTVYRKANTESNLVGLAEDGTLKIGGTLDDYYDAAETTDILIKDGEVAFKDGGATADDRSAQTAIGQTETGETLFIVATGGTYGSDVGVSVSDIIKILTDYGCKNATLLSGGSRSLMYWNGRFITETVGYPETGVRLPNSFVVLPKELG